MKRLMLIMSALIVLLSLNVCSAMVISQPVQIGDVFGINLGGFAFKNDISNNGNIIRNSGMKVYEKGTAVFGNRDKKLYMHYGHKISKYGGNSIDNAISIQTLDNKIFALQTNENLAIYIIYSDYDLLGEDDYTLIGEREDGRFVKYLETDKIFEQYYGKSNIVQYVTGVEAQGDTIIFKYGRWDWNTRTGPKGPIGEIRCKWDDNAQWFSVDNVIY